eukprot:GHVT01073801.1.p1 GENE.GHVT01073801.1~~GHVT01073801.1.p1  ORF type:complete len:215 (-),score=40.96 GHVT01073801.1:1557-2201(-)
MDMHGHEAEEADSHAFTRQLGGFGVVPKPLSSFEEDVVEDLPTNLATCPRDASPLTAFALVAPLAFSTPPPWSPPRRAPWLSARPRLPCLRQSQTPALGRLRLPVLCLSAYFRRPSSAEPIPDAAGPPCSRYFASWLCSKIESHGAQDNEVSAALESAPALVEYAARWKEHDAAEASIAALATKRELDGWPTFSDRALPSGAIRAAPSRPRFGR